MIHVAWIIEMKEEMIQELINFLNMEHNCKCYTVKRQNTFLFNAYVQFIPGLLLCNFIKRWVGQTQNMYYAN